MRWTSHALVVRIAIAASSASVALVVALAWALADRARGPGPAHPLDDPETREEVVAGLVAESAGVWDGFGDPDVGRVLLPGLEERRFERILVSSNRYGMRERDYALPKPEGTVRVAILGDSFVFGARVAPEDRLGVHLEQALGERARSPAEAIECLHLGLTSWNLRAETAWLRRQLGLLRPDLVVHVTVSNDLDDCGTARGFGGYASFSYQRPEQAGGILETRYPLRTLGFPLAGMLDWGLDHESRARFAEAAEEVARLAECVERAGGAYVLLVHWGPLNPIARERLAVHLRPDQVAYLPTDLYTDRRYWAAEHDVHWSPEGHERVAGFVYGLALERGWIAALDLAPWEEAERAAREDLGAALAAAERPTEYGTILANRPIAGAIEPLALDALSASQIHGGIERDGGVAPYASLMLANDEGVRLALSGHCYDRPELDGTVVEVLVDEHPLGRFQIEAGAPIDLAWELPAGVAGRPVVSVRFRSDDYAYAGNELRRRVVFALRRVAIER